MANKFQLRVHAALERALKYLFLDYTIVQNFVNRMTERVKGASGASRLEDVEYIMDPIKREEIKCVRTAGLVGKAKQLAELTGAHVTLLVQDPSKGPQVMFSTNGLFEENIQDFQRQHKRFLEQRREKAGSLSPPTKPPGKTREPSSKRARIIQQELSPDSKRTTPSKHLKNRIKICKDPVYVVPSDEFSSTIGANVRQQSLSLSGIQLEPGQLQMSIDSSSDAITVKKLENILLLPMPESPLNPDKLRHILIENFPRTLWRLPRIARGLVKYVAPMRRN